MLTYMKQWYFELQRDPSPAARPGFRQNFSHKARPDKPNRHFNFPKASNFVYHLSWLGKKFFLNLVPRWRHPLLKYKEPLLLSGGTSQAKIFNGNGKFGLRRVSSTQSGVHFCGANVPVS